MCKERAQVEPSNTNNAQANKHVTVQSQGQGEVDLVLLVRVRPCVLGDVVGVLFPLEPIAHKHANTA